MTLQEAIETLEAHNIWRRGADTEPANATQLGIAIDVVLAHCKLSLKNKTEY